MKAKAKQKKSTVQDLRDTREKIGQDIQNMSLEELMKYLKKKQPLYPKLRKRHAK